MPRTGARSGETGGTGGAGARPDDRTGAVAIHRTMVTPELDPCRILAEFPADHAGMRGRHNGDRRDMADVTKGYRASRRRMLGLAGGAALGVLAPGSAALAAKRCSTVNTSGLQFCEVGIPSDMLGQSVFGQELSQWCWAACISMIFHYHHHPVAQERIVAETFGNIVNMPANAEQILGAVNRGWVDDKGNRFESVGMPLPIDPNIASGYLQREQPLIIGSVGHATVLTALSWTESYGSVQLNSLTVRDPAMGGRRRQLSGQEAVLTSFLAFVGVPG